MTPTSTTLRLVWPQWQGASPHMVGGLLPELPLAQAQRGCAVGTTVLQAVLPPHDGPSAVVPVTLGPEGTEARDGVDAKDAVLTQLETALGVIAEHSVRTERIVTLGGECSVSGAAAGNCSWRAYCAGGLALLDRRRLPQRQAVGHRHLLPR